MPSEYVTMNVGTQEPGTEAQSRDTESQALQASHHNNRRLFNTLDMVANLRTGTWLRETGVQRNQRSNQLTGSNGRKARAAANCATEAHKGANLVYCARMVFSMPLMYSQC